MQVVTKIEPIGFDIGENLFKRYDLLLHGMSAVINKDINGWQLSHDLFQKCPEVQLFEHVIIQAKRKFLANLISRQR
ncbi:hypothetical protein GCM10027566_25180 [Arachidicoccus ginsenosidivorans]